MGKRKSELDKALKRGRLTVERLLQAGTEPGRDSVESTVLWLNAMHHRGIIKDILVNVTTVDDDFFTVSNLNEAERIFILEVIRNEIMETIGNRLISPWEEG